MYNPNSGQDMNNTFGDDESPQRPLPKPIADPYTPLWLPSDLEQEIKKSSVSRKTQVKHILNFALPIVGGALLIAFGLYVGSILIGVYF